MQAVDLRLDRLVLTLAGEHVFVQHGVCESELLLVVLSAESVGRRLVHEVVRKAQRIADLPHFMHQQVGKGAEIAGSVAVFGGIADIVLGSVAGIDDSRSAGQHLSHRVRAGG